MWVDILCAIALILPTGFWTYYTFNIKFRYEWNTEMEDQKGDNRYKICKRALASMFAIALMLNIVMLAVGTVSYLCVVYTDYTCFAAGLALVMIAISIIKAEREARRRLIMNDIAGVELE